MRSLLRFSVLLAILTVGLATSMRDAPPADQTLVYLAERNPADPVDDRTMFTITLEMAPERLTVEAVGWRITAMRVCRICRPGADSAEQIETWTTVDSPDELWWVRHADPSTPSLSEFIHPPWRTCTDMVAEGPTQNTHSSHRSNPGILGLEHRILTIMTALDHLPVAAGNPHMANPNATEPEGVDNDRDPPIGGGKADLQNTPENTGIVTEPASAGRESGAEHSSGGDCLVTILMGGTRAGEGWQFADINSNHLADEASLFLSMIVNGNDDPNEDGHERISDDGRDHRTGAPQRQALPEPCSRPGACDEFYEWCLQQARRCYTEVSGVDSLDVKGDDIGESGQDIKRP